MKKIICMVLIAIMLTACGQPNVISTNGHTKEYPTYGIFNENTAKSKDVCYEVSIGNVIWSIILVETIIMPVYFVGFSLYNPVSSNTNGCGVDSK